MLNRIRNTLNIEPLKLLKISMFFMNFMAIVPVIVLIYQAKGLTVGDFFMLQGISAIVAFLIEIPSGYLSDVCSRRRVLLAGAFLSFLSYVLLFFGYGMANMILFEALQGAAVALFSGTKEAYAYDLLKRDGCQQQFLKEYGAITTWSQVSGFVAAVIGGTLYAAIGDWIVAIEALFAAIGVVCLSFLPELSEVRRNIARETNPFRDIAGIVKMSVRHPELKWLMLFPALFGSFTLVLMWILQPTMQAVGVATALFGIFVGINQFMCVVYSQVTYKIYDRIGTRRVIGLLCIMLVICIMAVIMSLHTNNMWLIYCFCVIIAVVPASQKMCGLVFNTLVHHRIQSRERGTVLSVSSMYVTVLNGLMMLAMKPVLDGVGIQGTMLVLLGLMTLLLIPIWHIWKIKI